jgi:NAD(P)H-hydrate epimerase
MHPALTTEQMAEVDRLMIEEYGIVLIQMMENAGRNFAEQARRMLGGEVVGRYVAVLCGTGHNGGGGLVAARHLHNRGASVWVHLVGEENHLKDIPAHQLYILKEMDMSGSNGPSDPPEKPDLILDAMIGYGLQGSPRPNVAEWIQWANDSGSTILALDTPSGLDTTTGIPGQPCIRATATLTLALPKVGLLSSQASQFVGELYLADISVPPELYQKFGIKIGPIFTEDTIIAVK